MIESIIRHRKILKRFIPRKMRIWLKTQTGYRKAEKIGKSRKAEKNRCWGVNLYGELSGASGLAEASRSTRLGLEKAGIPLCLKDTADGKEEELLSPYAVNLFHMNPNQLPELLCRLPEKQWRASRNIGFWLWEQEKLPLEWSGFFPLFDEVWTSSEFCASAIRQSCSCPVTVIPHIVEPVYDASCDRAAFGLPEDMFLFLSMFDCDSVVDRKNPWGAIQAFLQAFGGREDRAGLVIKARNLDDMTRRKTERMLEGYPYVWLLEGDYPREQVNSLIHMADACVSLHRAEGFGLVLAEAMYLGTPVIATNWSANTEFMNHDVGCLVDAELVSLKKNEPPYRKGSRWAEPDLQQAAGYMRRLYEDEKYRTELAERAKAHIREQLCVEKAAGLLRARLTEIRKELEL